MQNEKFFTQVSKAKKTVTEVYRKAGNKKVGTITVKSVGYEANLGAGIRRSFATKAAAFAAFSN